MRNLLAIWSLGINFLLVACSSGTSIPSTAVTEIHATWLPIPPTRSATQIPAELSPTAPPLETRLKYQCLGVSSASIADLTSIGTVAFKSLTSDATIFVDMRTGQEIEVTSQGERQIQPTVSPDKKFIAYENIKFDASGEITEENLVIANSTGNSIHIIPWRKEWYFIPGWIDNQRLAITLEGKDEKPPALLIVNPFTGQQKIQKPHFPNIVNSSATVLPDWNGWFDVVYDPTLKLAVYPRYIDNNQEMYTYALWDLANSQIIASLDKVFTTSTAYNKFPLPHWSPDGSAFVFQGSVMVSDKLVTFELYRVNRDGETEQLTHLNPVFSFQESNLSWSPDGKSIAMFLNKYYDSESESLSQVAVLNMDTLDIVDFCNLVNHPDIGGDLPFSPIWSPDGRQFLVMDWYAKDHSRVILIDITKGTATQIAEDMQPVGWLVGEKQSN